MVVVSRSFIFHCYIRLEKPVCSLFMRAVTVDLCALEYAYILSVCVCVKDIKDMNECVAGWMVAAINYVLTRSKSSLFYDPVAFITQQ